MKQIMEELLHIPCEEKEFHCVDALPLFLRGSYRLKVLHVADTSFLTASPIEKVNLSSMRKHRKQLMDLAGMECAFRFEGISSYTRKKMLEEGIPFILEENELYLPFLGVVLNSSKKAKNPPPRISYLTQKMLLTVLYKGLTNSTVTEMANILGVSKMSVTRCYDELEAFHPSLIENKKTAGRYFIWNKTKRDLWERVRPILRNPVEKEFLLDCTPSCPLPKSGLTAISHFSMLADNSYPTYAISKQAVRELHLEDLPQVPQGDLPVAVIQAMGYVYLHENDSELVIDPLSAVLSLSQEEMSDPRIEGALEEIMKEFVYDRT
jgi:DNA-binding transcriptional regulator YhcF (GntR family)